MGDADILVRRRGFDKGGAGKDQTDAWPSAASHQPRGARI